MLKSWFSLTPPVNRGAYPKPSGDFCGTIWGYNSPILYPPVNKGLPSLVSCKGGLPYVWPQLTTPKLMELRFRLLPMRSTPFLIPRSSSIWVSCSLRSKTESIAWVEAKNEAPSIWRWGDERVVLIFYLRILKIWWCHQWHVSRILSCVSFILCHDLSMHGAPVRTSTHTSHT